MRVSNKLVDAVDPECDGNEVIGTLRDGIRTFGRTFGLVLVTHGRESDELCF